MSQNEQPNESLSANGPHTPSVSEGSSGSLQRTRSHPDEPTERDIPAGNWISGDGSTNSTHPNQRRTMRPNALTLAGLALVAAVVAGVLLVPGWLAPKITEGQDPRPTISAADVAQLLDQMEAATTDAQRWSYVEKLAGDGTPDATAAGLIKTQLGAKQYSEMTLIAAWRALHARGDQNYAAGRLIDATTSFRSTEAQREASALLMQVCTTAHEGSLVKLLESVFDAEIKINVARALWFTCKETTNSLQALRDLLTSDMTSVRLAAALAYAETGHISEVEPTIAELAQEPSMRGRLARQLLIKMRLDRTLEAIYIGLGRDNPNATPSKIVDPDVTTRIAEDVLTMIKERAAVDTERLSDVSVLRAAADQMIRAIDPYSGFLVNTAEADRWKTFASTLGTGQPGAGLVVGQPFGSIRVNAVIEGSPAARAGIRPGDLITEIDGHEIHEKSLIEIDTLLHGAAGSQVTVKLIRPGWFVTRAYTLTREVVPAPTISTKMLPGKLAWLRVPMCIGTEATATRAALTTLVADGATAVVLDLRGNPGGNVNVALGLADLFLPAGKLVCYSQGRNTDAAARKEYLTKDAAATDLPLVVLVDRGTADAAEILAGALQAHKRATLVGHLHGPDAASMTPPDDPKARGITFGKAMLQAVIPINFRPGASASPADFKGCALNLTIGFYYLPGDVLIQDRGLTPDVYVPEVDLAGWVMDELDRPEVVKAVAGYLAGAPAGLDKLADFDGGKADAWPGLAGLKSSTNYRGPLSDLRRYVRSQARAALAAGPDVQDDPGMRAAVMQALQASNRKPADVPEYARLAGN